MKKNQPITRKEIEYLRIALGLCGIGIGSQTACLINEVYKEVQRLGGGFSIRDAARIQYEVEQRYKQAETVKEKPNQQQKPKRSVASKAK
jgi:hypothetical protein